MRRIHRQALRYLFRVIHARKHLDRSCGCECALEVVRVLTFLDFWGPASNFGIPVAAVMDTQKDPDM